MRIPREVLDKKAVEQGDIRFFELAALSVKVSANPKGLRDPSGLSVTLTLTDFVIPPDDVPEEVSRAIKHWSQWIDYWAVDWDNKSDTFHNEWQTYRTHERGSMVAWEDGVSTAYALHNAEERGILFIGPGVEVYEGMIIGQNARGNDMPINVAKKKHLTNIRASVEDIAVRLTPLRPMSLDDCIEYISDDGLLEVTPLSLRMRKRILNTDMRRKFAAGRDITDGG